MTTADLRTLQVMIVEDHALVRAAVAHTLTRAGMVVVRDVGTAEDALAAIGSIPAGEPATSVVERCGSTATNNGCSRNFGVNNNFSIKISAMSTPWKGSLWRIELTAWPVMQMMGIESPMQV